jgi:hypothetical protein
MPYSATNSNSDLFPYVGNTQANGNGGGTPDGTGDYPKASEIQDYGVNPNFYTNAFKWEPKYQHKFVMSIPGGDGEGIPAYLIKTSAKPSMTNGEVVIDHINVKRKLKGKSSWNSIAITIYDAIVPSAAQAVMQWVRLHHESATGRDGYASIYKKDITLNQLSPLGEVIEEWKLKGCYLSEVNFGSLDWSTEDVVMIDATLNYDWALLSY